VSSTTRAGFLIPAVTDLTDETLYYDNNVTVLERELPSQRYNALPTTGNYNGRIQTINNSTPVGINPALTRQNYVYTASGWANLGAFAYKKQLYSQPGVSTSTQQAIPVTSGAETFAPVPMDGIASVSLVPNMAYRFHCEINQYWGGGFSSGQPGPSLGFKGKMNLFIDPTSGTQPTPTTGTAVRLSAPIVTSDKDVGNYQVNGVTHYCELFYSPNVANPITAGLAAYISATKTDPNWQPTFQSLFNVSGYGGQTVYSMNLKIEALGMA
jgi:hypothetical protein